MPVSKVMLPATQSWSLRAALNGSCSSPASSRASRITSGSSDGRYWFGLSSEPPPGFLQRQSLIARF